MIDAKELIIVNQENSEGQIFSYIPFRFNECYTTDEHASVKFILTDPTSTIITVEKFTGRKCDKMNLRASFDYAKYSPEIVEVYSGLTVVSLYVGERPKNTVGCMGIQGEENCVGHENVKKICLTDVMSNPTEWYYFRPERVDNTVVTHQYTALEFMHGEYVRTERRFDCNVCYESSMYECP